MRQAIGNGTSLHVANMCVFVFSLERVQVYLKV